MAITPCRALGRLGTATGRRKSMKLKSAILDILTRDDLRRIVDDLGMDGVDRRSADAMPSAQRRARRAKPEDLLGYMRKNQMKGVCEAVGVSAKGKRDELVERLVNAEEAKPNQAASKTIGKGTPVASNGAVNGQVSQSEINGILWKACDTFRGAVDPSEYKNYILVMLFVKYISDVWQDHYDQLKAEYGA